MKESTSRHRVSAFLDRGFLLYFCMSPTLITPPATCVCFPNCAGSRLCDSRLIHRGETAFQQPANIRAPSAAGPLKLFGHRSQSYVHMLYVDSFAAHSSRTSILKSTFNSLTSLPLPRVTSLPPPYHKRHPPYAVHLLVLFLLSLSSAALLFSAKRRGSDRLRPYIRPHAH